MATSRLLALSCAATFALAVSAASAQSASVGVSVDTGPQSELRDARDRACLRQTGTRINTRVRSDDADVRGDGRAANSRSCGFGRGRVYSRADIDSTGRTDIGDALRALDPSIR